jgi:hypothetical protein
MRYSGLLRWHDHQTPLAIVALGSVPDVCDEGGTGGSGTAEIDDHRPRATLIGTRRDLTQTDGLERRECLQERAEETLVDGNRRRAAANEFAVRRAICVPLRRLPAASRSPLFPQRKHENGAIRGHEGLVSGESTAANPHSGGLSEPVFGRARSTGPLLLSPSRDSPKYGYESASGAVGVGRAPCRGIRTLDGCNPIAIFKPAARFSDEG